MGTMRRDQLAEEQRDIERRMEEYNARIKMLEQEKKIKKEQANILPPIDRFDSARHVETFRVAVGKGEANNHLKSDVKQNVFLLILLLVAIIFTTILAFKLLNQI